MSQKRQSTDNGSVDVIVTKRKVLRFITFANVGVDYFDAFSVEFGFRREKRWCCLFKCLTVQAVHLKMGTDSWFNKIRWF